MDLRKNIACCVEWIYLAEDNALSGCYQYGNELLDSINGEEFLYLLNYHIMKDCAAKNKYEKLFEALYYKPEGRGFDSR
jgi:hypothetical protein